MGDRPTEPLLLTQEVTGRAMLCPACKVRLEQLANFCPGCGEDLRGLTPTSDTLSGPWSGRIIDERYRLLEKLGEGGMGSVFKVEHVRMGKILALKILRPDLAIDKKMKQRFVQEARVVSRLSHPNTIQVFDFGELEDGSLYIAMEYLPGRDLMWLLRSHGAFSEERAITIAVQVLASLAEAHELGIIHRDIKPANVMLLRRKDGGETAKVLDFGIAKLNEGEGRKHITGIADFVGTPAYMSPEQGKGEPLDARSDLYSVAAMLFELVTGRIVFDGATPMSIVSQHMTEPPPRFSQVAPEKVLSPAFEQVVRKALSKDPSDRYANADQMRLALERVRRELGGALSDQTPAAELNTDLMARREDFDHFERSLRRKRVALPVLVLSLLGLTGAAGWHYLMRAPAPKLLSEEREPNHEPAQANRIPLGETVTGRMGAALSEGESDRDMFVIDLASPSALTVEVSGVPDMNLVVEAFQAQALTGAAASGGQKIEEKLQRLVVLDDGRTGEGERVDGLRLQPGSLYLRIQEQAHASEPMRPPRESTRSTYSLTVRRTQVTPDDRLEHEPDNDGLDTAPALPVARAVRGFTGAAIPLKRGPSDRTTSAVDIHRVEPARGSRVFAVLVPPAGVRMIVADAHSAASSAVQETEDAPLVLPLIEKSGRGHAVRVQASPTRTTQKAPPDPAAALRAIAATGAPYYVAFFTDQKDGLEGVFDLLSVLREDGLDAQRQQVTDELRKALKGSPQLDVFNAHVDAAVATDGVR